VLPSSTTVSASPSSSYAGTPVTLTATVGVLGQNGLGITPTGSVKFTSTNGSATVTLGSASLGSCLLTQCTATLTTSSIPVGTVSVTASYPGDSLVGPSSGSTPVTVAPNPSPGSSSTVVCYAGQPCDTGPVSTGQKTSADVSAPPSSSTQTLSATTTTQQLHCAPAGKPDGDGDDDDSTPFPGDLVTFSDTATDVGKTLKYTGTGSTGSLMLHQYQEHTAFVGCYGSTSDFYGYTGGKYGLAPFNAQDGLFEAQLSNCALHSGQKPCFTNTQGSGTTDTYNVFTPAGDPKYIG
jgi:hypothetical protein